MTAFASIPNALSAGSNIGREAIHTSDGGASVPERIVSRQADAIAKFGDARLWSGTTRLDLRVAEVAKPRPGDRKRLLWSGQRRRSSSAPTTPAR